MSDIPPEDHPLRAAAKFLGVAEVVEAEPAGSEDLYRLRLATAVCGAADGYALHHASNLAKHTGDDPVDVTSELRFLCVGMAGTNTDRAALLWAIWTLRQAQARVAKVDDRASEAELVASRTALHAVHGLLSAAVQRSRGNTDAAEGCLDEARQSLAGHSAVARTSRAQREHSARRPELVQPRRRRDRVTPTYPGPGSGRGAAVSRDRDNGAYRGILRWR